LEIETWGDSGNVPYEKQIWLGDVLNNKMTPRVRADRSVIMYVYFEAVDIRVCTKLGTSCFATFALGYEIVSCDAILM
jgi:hypothetical protein